MAVVLFVVRILPAALREAWGSVGSDRLVGIAALWVFVALPLFMYLLAAFIANPDAEALPFGVLIASDHAVFVGVVTNLLFALVATFAASVPSRRPRADHVVFWGMNVGLALFAVGLIVESSEVKRIGSPVMGLAIFLGLAVLGIRVWAARDTESA